MPTVNDQDAERDKGRRMTLSRMVEALLERRDHGPSSVTVARNAKGETQLEVVVRTAEGGPITTLEQAEAAACEVYDRLRRRYPMSSGMVGAASPPAASSGTGSSASEAAEATA